MSREAHDTVASKVPAVTLVFWIIKIAATTLGETGGDTVTMTLNWGYLAGTALFLSALWARRLADRGKRFHPWLYWATIIASTTAGTTLADFADRSLGIGYTGGATDPFRLPDGGTGLWYWTQGSISVETVNTPKVEAFYWAAITFSQTLGTALGDWMAIVRVSAMPVERSSLPERLQFLAAFILERTFEGVSVLGGVYPDAAARRHGRRFSRQAVGPWRPCV